MTITSVGTPAAPATNTSGAPVTGVWGTGQNRAAVNLLVALVGAAGSGGGNPTTSLLNTTGWTKLAEAVQADACAAIWTRTATGGDAAPEFTAGISGSHQDMVCALYELHDSGGTTPAADTTGTASNAGTSPLTVTTAGNVTGAGEFALALIIEGDTIISSSNSWGASGSWSNAFTDGTVLFWHWVVGTQAGPASGGTLAYAPSFSNTANAAAGVSGVFTAGVPLVTQNALLVF